MIVYRLNVGQDLEEEDFVVQSTASWPVYGAELKLYRLRTVIAGQEARELDLWIVIYKLSHVTHAHPATVARHLKKPAVLTRPLEREELSDHHEAAVCNNMKLNCSFKQESYNFGRKFLPSMYWV